MPGPQGAKGQQGEKKSARFALLCLDFLRLCLMLDVFILGFPGQAGIKGEKGVPGPSGPAGNPVRTFSIVI